jgi:chorismate synthase
MLRYLTAGESHGKAITSILEGMPANLELSIADIDKELFRRQAGYGRGARQAIEKDKVEILSGVRLGKTLGSPIALMVPNKDWDNWQKIMTVEAQKNIFQDAVTKLRPGHADLTGITKYDQADIRNILERASARTTVGLVAVGAIAKKFLSHFKMEVFSHVIQIGEVQANVEGKPNEITRAAEKSELRCADPAAELKMKKLIDKYKSEGDSVGGVFEVLVTGCPVGLGTHVHFDRKLSTKLAAAVASIQSVKGIEFGCGFAEADLPGSRAHDEIFFENGSYVRHTNRAGGLEGGMTNGQPIVIRAAVKPVATIGKPLDSVDLVTKEAVKAHVERADVCHVPSAGVIAEAAVAIEIANAFLEKFGGDSIEEIAKRYPL